MKTARKPFTKKEAREPYVSEHASRQALPTHKRLWSVAGLRELSNECVSLSCPPQPHPIPMRVRLGRTQSFAKAIPLQLIGV